MRIGIEATHLEGQPTGVGRYLINLLKEWQKDDLELVLYFKKEIPHLDSIGSFEKKLLKTKSKAFFIHYLLPRAAKKDKIDILFCPGYIGPIFYQGKIALVLHDIIYQARPDDYNWPSIWDKILLKWISRKTAEKAEVILTPSQFSKEEVLKHYQVNPEKVFVTSEAADQSFRKINNQQKIEQVKRKYKIKDNFILYVGSIFKRRHLPELIKSFESISNKLPNYQFLIIGHNYLKQKLEGNSILSYDYLQGDDLITLYNAADLFVYLSDYEGFGLPVLESMACGTPVITSYFASLPEVAGEAALYVRDNSDTVSIANTIYQGLTDQKLREELIDKGFKQAQKFSWQKCAEQTLDILLEHV